MTPAGLLQRVRRAWVAEPPVAPPLAEGEVPCPNCGAAVAGPYCARCGQETTVALPTARAFLREAAGRYVALDGRTWRTLASLFFRPGFLTREYLAGRRRRYVRPGRLFLVLSLALFAAFRLLAAPSALIRFDEATKNAPTAAPSAGAGAARASTSGPVTLDVTDEVGTSDGPNFRVAGEKYPWLAPLMRRFDDFNKLPKEQKTEQMFNGMMRYGPYAMVALLPVFAALMMLAYVGRTRRYPQRPRRYAAHLVFGAHDHAFLFLAAVAAAVIRVQLVRVAIGAWVVVYLLRSMKVVYGGRWSGVVLRAAFVGVLYCFMFFMAMAVLVVAAVALR